MSTELDPIVGSWYHDAERDQNFRVVDIDEEEGMITVQNVDGDLEQIEEDAWFDMELEPAETPEDWTEPDVGLEAGEVELEEPDWRAAREDTPSAKEDWDEDDEEGDDWDDDESDEDSYS